MESHSNISHSGICKALGAAALFGISTPIAKGLLGRIDPQMFAGLLYLGCGLGLGIVWLVRRGEHQAPLQRTDLK